MKSPHARHVTTLRLTFMFLMLGGLLSACAGPSLEVAAAPSHPSVTLREAGIHLTILPHTWTGYPSDLSQYYTPVEVIVENNRPTAIQVRYQDLVAVDSAHNQYRAVAPVEVVNALYGLGGHLEASAGAWGPYPYPYWHPYAYPLFSPYYAYPYFPLHFREFFPSPGYDILSRGLREGLLLPGARVHGFVYLQLATEAGQSLTLRWSPVDANGKRITTFRSQFQIVR